MLVVVLIIGIIAAIALPQYQLAVLKTRYTQLMIMGDALHKAQDAYYLAHGKYSLKINDLDITVPADCRVSDSGGAVTCSKFNCVVYDVAPFAESEGVVYCTMRIDGTGQIYYRISPLRKNIGRYCMAPSASDSGKKLCERVGGRFLFVNSDNRLWYYQL